MQVNELFPIRTIQPELLFTNKWDWLYTVYLTRGNSDIVKMWLCADYQISNSHYTMLYICRVLVYYHLSQQGYQLSPYKAL